MRSSPLLARLLDLVLRRRALVVALLVLASAISVLGVLRIEMETDILAMLPRRDPAVRAFERTLRARGSTDLLLVLVSLTPEGEPEDLTVFGEDLEPRLREMPEVRSVRWRATDEEREAMVGLFLSKGLLLLTEEEHRLLLDHLSPEGLRARVERTRRMLLSPASTATRELLLHDPLGLVDLFQGVGERISDPDVPVTADPASGALIAPDGRSLLVLVSPSGSPQDPRWARGLLDGVETRLEDTRRATGAPVAWGLTGGAAIATSDAAVIRRDMQITIFGSLVAVAFLFGLVFRRLRLLLAVGLVLGLGLLWTFGACGLAAGRLTLATAAFGAIIIGLGVDFSIHLVARFGEERHRGRPPEKALEATMLGTGRAVVAGALTTATAFGVLALARFPGLRQLGAISGAGVLLTLAASLLALPVLLATLPNLAPRQGGRDWIGELCRRLALLSIRFRWWVLILAALLVAAGAGVSWRGIPFQASARALRPEGSEPDRVMEELEQIFQTSSVRVDVVVDGPDEATRQVRLVALREVLEDLQEEGWVQGYASPLSLLPLPEDQDRRIQSLAALDPPEIQERLRGSLLEAGLRPAPFEEGIRILGDLLRPTRLEREDLQGPLEEVLSLLELQDGGRITVVRIPGDRWSDPGLAAALARIEAVPEAHLTGVDALNRRVRILALQDLRRLLMLAAVLVLLLLGWELRRTRLVLVAALPVTVGIAGTVAMLDLLGLSVNLMNLVAIPIIVGIGIDDGIHLVRRYLEEGRDPVEAAARTGRAVVLTSLTTCAGFGSLVLASYRGLASIGQLSLIGVLGCLVASLVVLPAALSVLGGRS